MDDRDPIDTLIKTALTADRATARRLAEEAISDRGSTSRLVPVLTAFAVVVAAGIGATRYAVSEPPIVIRGEGDTIVVESGSRLHRNIETFRDEQPRGGVVIIREGGDR
jgi:hypothetical protein